MQTLKLPSLSRVSEIINFKVAVSSQLQDRFDAYNDAFSKGCALQRHMCENEEMQLNPQTNDL